MSLRATIDKDLKTIIERDLDCPVFTYRGEDYACIPGSDESILSVDGPISSDGEVRFTVQKSLFVEFIPQSLKRITYRGKEYQIRAIREDISGAMYVIQAVDPDRNV